MSQRNKFNKFLIMLLLGAIILSTSGSGVLAREDISILDCDCCVLSGEQQFTNLSTEDLDLEHLKQKPEVNSVHENFGALLWDEAISQVGKENQKQIVMIPIDMNKPTNEVQVLFVGTKDGEQFRFMVFGFTPGELSIFERQGISGSLKIYSLDGDLSILANYQEGQLKDALNLTNEVNPLGMDWLCFTSCLAGLGLAFGWPCYVMCSACFALPHPYNPACWGCAGCIGVGAFTCILLCWE